MSFQHPQLVGSKAIRLLRLRPGGFEDDIECNMLVADLEDNILEYTALSYVWGRATDTTSVTCNDCVVKVTKNLHMALRRLRNTESVITVWVDALCINQLDDSERFSQILLMRDIYRYAHSVVAYLGEAISGTGPAIDLIHKLDSVNELDSAKERERVMTDSFYRGLPNTRGIPPRTDPAWSGLQDLLRREYFTRIWVIQEIAVSSNDPSIVCGPFHISWTKLVNVVRLNRSTGVSFSMPLSDNAMAALFMGTTRTSVLQGEQLRMNNLLQDTRKFCSTDPRDKIFALLGLATDIRTADGRLLLHVNYATPVEQVYISMTNFLMYEEDSNLRVLSYCGDPDRRSRLNLPSWVPDFSLPAQFASIGWSNFEADRGLFDYYISPTLQSRGAELSGTAYLLDRIQAVNETSPEDRYYGLLQNWYDPDMLLKFWKNFIAPNGDGALYVTGGTAFSAFWRTLITNQTKDEQIAPDTYLVHFLCNWRQARMTDYDLKAIVEERLLHEEGFDPSHLDIQKGIHDMRFFTREELEAHKRSYNRKINIALRLLGISCEECQYVEPLCDRCKAAEAETDDAKFSHLPPLREDDPCLDMMKDDIFIAEWYKRLRGDFDLPLPIIEGCGNDYKEALATFHWGRKLFRCHHTGLLGLGPRYVQAGDAVAVLPGSRVPIVLRPVIDPQAGLTYTYTLVGNAYVHGMMDGRIIESAVNQTPCPGLKKITIR